jgi:hypothetical protein
MPQSVPLRLLILLQEPSILTLPTAAGGWNGHAHHPASRDAVSPDRRRATLPTRFHGHHPESGRATDGKGLGQGRSDLLGVGAPRRHTDPPSLLDRSGHASDLAMSSEPKSCVADSLAPPLTALTDACHSHRSRSAIRDHVCRVPLLPSIQKLTPFSRAADFLSTAANSLGVLFAVSTKTGEPLEAVSWEEMRDPTTGEVEARKVAGPE